MEASKLDGITDIRWDAETGAHPPHIGLDGSRAGETALAQHPALDPGTPLDEVDQPSALATNNGNGLVEGEVVEPSEEEDTYGPPVTEPDRAEATNEERREPVTGREVAPRDEAQSPARQGVSLELSPTKLWASHREKRGDKAEARKAAQIQRWAEEDAPFKGVKKIDPDTLAPDLEIKFAELVAHRLPPIVGAGSAGSAIFSDVGKFAGAHFIANMHQTQAPTPQEKELQSGTPYKVIDQGNKRLLDFVPVAADVGVNAVLESSISADESARRAVRAITKKLGRPDIEVFKDPKDGHMWTDGFPLAKIIEEESKPGGRILARRDMSFEIERPNGVGETFRTVAVVQDDEDSGIHHVIGIKPDRPQAPGDDPDPRLHVEAVALALHAEHRVINAINAPEVNTANARISLAGTHFVTSQAIWVDTSEALEWLSDPTAIGVRRKRISPQRLAIENGVAPTGSSHRTKVVDAELVDEPDLWGQPNGHPV